MAKKNHRRKKEPPSAGARGGADAPVVEVPDVPRHARLLKLRLALREGAVAVSSALKANVSGPEHLDIDTPGERGVTLLGEACDSLYVEAALTLLEHGADPNFAGPTPDRSALYAAIETHARRSAQNAPSRGSALYLFMRLLAHARLDVEFCEQRSVLALTVPNTLSVGGLPADGARDVCVQLLRRGFSPHAPHARGSLLGAAWCFGHYQCAEALALFGADLSRGVRVSRSAPAVSVEELVRAAAARSGAPAGGGRVAAEGGGRVAAEGLHAHLVLSAAHVRSRVPFSRAALREGGDTARAELRRALEMAGSAALDAQYRCACACSAAAPFEAYSLWTMAEALASGLPIGAAWAAVRAEETADARCPTRQPDVLVCRSQRIRALDELPPRWAELPAVLGLKRALASAQTHAFPESPLAWRDRTLALIGRLSEPEQGEAGAPLLRASDAAQQRCLECAAALEDNQVSAHHYDAGEHLERLRLLASAAGAPLSPAHRALRYAAEADMLSKRAHHALARAVLQSTMTSFVPAPPGPSAAAAAPREGPRESVGSAWLRAHAELSALERAAWRMHEAAAHQPAQPGRGLHDLPLDLDRRVEYALAAEVHYWAECSETERTALAVIAGGHRHSNRPEPRSPAPLLAAEPERQARARLDLGALRAEDEAHLAACQARWRTFCLRWRCFDAPGAPSAAGRVGAEPDSPRAAAARGAAGGPSGAPAESAGGPAAAGAPAAGAPPEAFAAAASAPATDGARPAKKGPRGVCAHCGHCRAKGEPTMRKCGACRAVYYCDRECQRAGWHAHRLLCEASGAAGGRGEEQCA